MGRSALIALVLSACGGVVPIDAGPGDAALADAQPVDALVDARPDARPPDAAPDAEPPGATRLTPTGGGGAASSTNFKLKASIGAPQPYGPASGTTTKVQLGPRNGP